MGYVKKTAAVMFAAVLGSSVLAGGSQAWAQDTPGVTKDEVTIGAWVALTGPVAVYGVPLRAGVQSYFEAINAKGGVNGRKVNWIVEDNAYNPQQTVAVARKLASRDNVLAAVVAHGTAQTAAAFPYFLDEAKIPILLPYAGAKEWYDPPKQGLFGLHVLYEDQANAIGRWAGKDGYKKVLVVHGAHAAFENVANNVKPGLTAVVADGEVELMPVKIGTTDYAPITLEIARKKPDAIVAIQTLNEIVLLAKGLKQQGVDIPIYSYHPTVAQATIKLGGEFVEGLKSLSLTSSPFADTDAAKQYRADLAKYGGGEEPDFVSYLGYGAAKIFVEALANAKEPITRESIVQAFAELKGYDSGIFPPVSFSAEHAVGGHLLQPMEIKSGKWVPVGDIIDVRKF